MEAFSFQPAILRFYCYLPDIFIFYNKYIITVVLKVETGRAVILVIMYVEIFQTGVIVFIGEVKICLRSHCPIHSSSCLNLQNYCYYIFIVKNVGHFVMLLCFYNDLLLNQLIILPFTL
jgi:hypothetical protein